MIAGEKYSTAVATTVRPANYGKSWEVDDYAKLIRMYMQGESSGSIAEVVGRTPKVVVSVLRSLGFLEHDMNYYNYTRSEIKLGQVVEGCYSGSTAESLSIPALDWTKVSRHFLAGMPISAIARWCKISVGSMLVVLHKLSFLKLVSGEGGTVRYEHAYQPLLKNKIKSSDDTVQGGVIEIPSPLPTIEEPTMIAIENRTYINDINAADMTDDQVFLKIADLEKEMAKLEAIKNKPQKLLGRINDMQVAITKLVKYVDER